MTHDEYRNQILILRDQVKPLEAALKDLLKNCPHHYVCHRCGEQSTSHACAKESYFGHGYTRCTICDQTGQDWYCPDSPDHACHYRTEPSPAHPSLRVVILNNGTAEPYSHEGHDPNYETEDECLYCGSPEERK